MAPFLSGSIPSTMSVPSSPVCGTGSTPAPECVNLSVPAARIWSFFELLLLVLLVLLVADAPLVLALSSPPAWAWIGLDGWDGGVD